MVLERNGIVESAEAAAAKGDAAVAEALARLAAPATAAAPETPQGVPGRAGLPVDVPAEIVPQEPVQAPVQQAPVQAAPTEAPVQEVPTQAPVQEAPVQAPVQQAPVQHSNLIPARQGSATQYAPLSAEAAAASKPRRRADASKPVAYEGFSF
ncbi:hypothetical protein SEA_HURRICANE_97 [Mycobacterium phage Hurricane]|uniref:Uncharacterized protein n=1 Tax=Mycobacterium phage Hurricane TaxID=2015810 RepID=A0A222ZKZ1_9CAUD|nr:hypothetical protein I5G83_gp97 [Mycobacterium phage Hurricane]ASR84851.1 hypothetical protein SEA_HURRICANE_97 [Mycobacterium phage Hurricane]